MRSGKLLLIFFVLFGSVGFDQITKVIAREHLDGLGTLSYFGDTFRLVYIENHGAFLGMGSSLPEHVRTLIFVGLVSIFLLGFLIWVIRDKTLSNIAVVASSLMIGGGIGNLIDRVLFEGGVTDFLNIGIGSLRTGIFNIADVFIVAGFLLLAVSPDLWKELRKPPEDESPTANEST